MNDYYLATKWRERVERERAYTSGELPPNYPVPAIRTFVKYTQHSGNRGNFGRYEEWRSAVVGVYRKDKLGLNYLVEVLAWKKMPI